MCLSVKGVVVFSHSDPRRSNLRRNNPRGNNLRRKTNISQGLSKPKMREVIPNSWGSLGKLRKRMRRIILLKELKDFR